MSKSALAEQILRTARERGHESLLLRAPAVVAVSGGADSLALLDMLIDLRGESAGGRLQVAHVNHGLRGDEAAADAKFVLQFAQARGISCTLEYVDARREAEQSRLSLEDAARRLRYGALARVAADTESTVITAHTADDQAETVMMNLLRGAGLTGLRGMSMLSE